MYKSFIYSNDRLGINLNALLDEEGEIWFIGKEITDFLEYKNSRKALKDHVDIEDKGGNKTLHPWRKTRNDNNKRVWFLLFDTKK